MRQSKIFFLRSKKTRHGGAEVYLSRLSDALKDKGVQHEVIHSIFPDFLSSWIKAILFNFQTCLFKKDRFYFSLERITCPDIYRAGDGVHKVFLKNQKKSKSNPLHLVYLFLEKRCFNNAKLIVANSNMVKRQIIDSYCIDSEKIKVVYNGIKLKDIKYEYSFNKISKEFFVSKNHAILIYVGSGFKRKGVEEFLNIIAKLNDTNIKAFVIGKEKNIDYYLKLSKSLKIGDNIIFTGPRDDVDDFYTIGDIFILPTNYEPFSNVVLEAMNFGNVVFTTKQNGAHEILDDYFVMKDPSDLSILSKITLLLKDKKALNGIKSKNIEKSKQFSIENNLNRTLDLIETARK